MMHSDAPFNFSFPNTPSQKSSDNPKESAHHAEPSATPESSTMQKKEVQEEKLQISNFEFTPPFSLSEKKSSLTPSVINAVKLSKQKDNNSATVSRKEFEELKKKYSKLNKEHFILKKHYDNVHGQLLEAHKLIKDFRKFFFPAKKNTQSSSQSMFPSPGGKSKPPVNSPGDKPLLPSNSKETIDPIFNEEIEKIELTTNFKTLTKKRELTKDLTTESTNSKLRKLF